MISSHDQRKNGQRNDNDAERLLSPAMLALVSAAVPAIIRAHRSSAPRLGL